ncbi:MAG: MATE family efflux transporter [Erysipelotrichaceae bacterium]
MNKKLLEGNITKTLIAFSLPFLASNLIQSLYNVVDMVVVGQFSGTESSSGVVIGGQATFIITFLAIGLCNGAAIMIGQYIGANKMDRVKKVIGTLSITIAVLAIVITVLLLFFADPFLLLIKTPTESFLEAKAYLSVTSLGIFFIFMYNALAAVIRATGDSKTPMNFILIACIMNIFLDLLFIINFNMGAKGAAIATVISQATSAILCVIYMKRSNFIFDFKLSSFRVCKEELSHILRLGLPMSIQNTITGLSFVFLTALVNMTSGVIGSAAQGAISRFNNFGILPAAAISLALSTIVAQNLGANQLDRAKQALRVAFRFAFACGFFVFFVGALFPAQILGIFTKDPEVVAMGIDYMRFFVFDFLFVPFSFCFNGFFMGAGATKFSMFNNIFNSVILRVPIAYFLAITLNMGLVGISFSIPLSSIGAIIISTTYYLSKKWLKIKLV